MNTTLVAQRTAGLSSVCPCHCAMLLLMVVVAAAVVVVVAMHQSHLPPFHQFNPKYHTGLQLIMPLCPSPTFSTAPPVFSSLLILFVLWSSFKCFAGDCRPKVLRSYIQQHGFSCHLVTIISHLPHISDTTLQLSPESRSRFKILLFIIVWIAVFGSGVAYCISSWLLADSDATLARIRRNWSECVGADCAPFQAEARRALSKVLEYLRVRASTPNTSTVYQPFMRADLISTTTRALRDVFAHPGLSIR